MSVSARTGLARAEPPGPGLLPDRAETGPACAGGGGPPSAHGAGAPHRADDRPPQGAADEAPDGSAEDADLVRRALRGDHLAWEGIVDRHLPVVNAIARSYRLSGPDREDAVQTVWLTLNQHLPRLRHPGRLRAWLRRVAHRTCARQRRTGSLDRAVDPHDLAALPLAGAPDPEAEYLRGERGEELHRAIRSLTDPAERRAALAYLADPSGPGAAGRTGRPEEGDGPANPRAASNQRRRVFRRLRRLLEEPT
ncbi:RNA polymerase sigma factor [Nocardiopsis sp. NPDC101807]|uniref:RNA polymerase sigma factor n=1 Tax=Nocardiopsis sp. NPDC101807 TaxID=3364339 RepID=UPI0037FFEA85